MRIGIRFGWLRALCKARPLRKGKVWSLCNRKHWWRIFLIRVQSWPFVLVTKFEVIKRRPLRRYTVFINFAAKPRYKLSRSMRLSSKIARDGFASNIRLYFPGEFIRIDITRTVSFSIAVCVNLRSEQKENVIFRLRNENPFSQRFPICVYE